MTPTALSAAQNYGLARPVTAPAAQDQGPAKALRDSAHSFAQALAQADRTAEASLTGNADPHALVQALAQAELAVETAVTMRNKVVEAYLDILRMPV